jgi:hypothetical protein
MHGETVKYIVESFALLGQHVFQAVVCIECRAECDSVTLCTALDTHTTT